MNSQSPAPHTIIEQLSFDRDVPLRSLKEEYDSLWNDLACNKAAPPGDIDDDDEFYDAVEFCDEHDEHGALKNENLHGIRCGHVADMSRRFDPKPPPLPFPQKRASGHIGSSDGMCAADGSTYRNETNEDPLNFVPIPPPPPPKELPVRFLRAGKGDPQVGWERFEKTLAWRKENGIDTILQRAHPNFDLIKSNYPHYYHLRGRGGEPVFFELPPKTNLAAMRAGGVDLDSLLRHYAMVTEFQWQFIERDDFARSITVIDLEGIGMRDFMGECVDYVRKCSEFTGQHYPERAGVVMVINVPGWFKIIWNVVKPMVDEVTLKKIRILRGKKEIFDSLLELIPVENIPPEYGGSSVPLGQSPEENLLRDLIHHNNRVAEGDRSCGGKRHDCPFCSFIPARSY